MVFNELKSNIGRFLRRELFLKRKKTLDTPTVEYKNKKQNNYFKRDAKEINTHSALMHLRR